MSTKRINIRAILADPAQRRALMTSTIIATQAREGIETTQEQAEAAYDKVRAEKYPYACATCSHEQATMDPCGSCGSVRVVLVSVLRDLFGADWRATFRGGR